MLRCFELTSGLKVNFSKSKVAGVSIERNELARFASLLNCKTMEIPCIYLGISVGANPRRKATWDPLIQKLRKKLSTWKYKSLSFGGKICLL